MQFLVQKYLISAEIGTIYELAREHNWLYPDVSEAHCIEKLSYHTLTNDNDDEWDLCLDYCKNAIPVGSIEFVSAFINKFYGINSITPLLIPSELAHFAKRKIAIVDNKDFLRDIFDKWKTKKLFIKSASVLKADYTDIYDEKSAMKLPDDIYFVSEVLEDIVSEWRVFVYNGVIQDIRCYDGNPWVMPDKETVEKMVKDYKNCSPAYTLDVAVANNINDQTETVIVEVHNFISCGFYGFHQKELLPMLNKAFKWEINRTARDLIFDCSKLRQDTKYITLVASIDTAEQFRKKFKHIKNLNYFNVEECKNILSSCNLYCPFDDADENYETVSIDGEEYLTPEASFKFFSEIAFTSFNSIRECVNREAVSLANEDPRLHNLIWEKVAGIFAKAMILPEYEFANAIKEYTSADGMSLNVKTLSEKFNINNNIATEYSSVLYNKKTYFENYGR